MTNAVIKPQSLTSFPVKDAQIILRDMVGDAATKTANRVNPTEEQLAQLDDPAADNTWHETPDFKGMKAEYQEKYNKNKLFGKNQAQKTLDNSAQVAQAEGAEAGANAGLVDAKQRLDENIPEEKQDQARQYRERTQNYLREKMPKERREQTIWRLKKMVVEVQGHQDCECIIQFSHHHI